MDLLVGYGGRAGLLEYILIPLLLIKWMEEKYVTSHNRLLRDVLGVISGVFLIPKIMSAALITLVSLPLIFIYNRVLLFIGKPLKKSVDTFEVLPLSGYQCSKEKLSSIHQKDYLPLDCDVFCHAFYDEIRGGSQLDNLYRYSPYGRLGFERFLIEPLFIKVSSENICLILGLFEHDFLDSFIVPSKEKKAMLKLLMANKLLVFSSSFTPEMFDRLDKALDEEDPFILKKQREKELRIETTVMLLIALSPDIQFRKQNGSGVFDVCSIIINYAGLLSTNTAEKIEVAKKIQIHEQGIALCT